MSDSDLKPLVVALSFHQFFEVRAALCGDTANVGEGCDRCIAAGTALLDRQKGPRDKRRSLINIGHTFPRPYRLAICRAYR